MITRWDRTFLQRAANVAQDSKDPSSKVGCLIVSPDRVNIVSGYNGFPRKMDDNPAWLANREEKYSRVIHAEMNALIFARQNLDGYTCYTYPFMPCDRCFVHMVQAGITRFVYPTAPHEALMRWQFSFDRVRQYAAEMGIELVEVGDGA